jgi:hypothetical protein
MNYGMLGPAFCLATTKSFLSLNQSFSEQERTPSQPTSKVGMITDKPLLRVGVVSDIQYCNIKNGTDYTRTVQRHYRGSLAMVDYAAQYWKVRNVDMVFQVGLHMP